MRAPELAEKIATPPRGAAGPVHHGTGRATFTRKDKTTDDARETAHPAMLCRLHMASRAARRSKSKTAHFQGNGWHMRFREVRHERVATHLSPQQQLIATTGDAVIIGGNDRHHLELERSGHAPCSGGPGTRSRRKHRHEDPRQPEDEALGRLRTVLGSGETKYATAT